MKTLIAFVLVMVSVGLPVFAQLSIPRPSDGKAVVYFVRTSNMGMAINFSYFDSLTLIGRFAGPAYIRYECEPGHHLFWARSENRDFVEAELEAGKIYFILADVAMGGIKAQVDLVPVNPRNDSKTMKRILKLIERQSGEQFTAEQLERDRADLEKAVERGMESYSKEQMRGVNHDVLASDMDYER